MILYFLICLISVLVGCGILSLLGIPIDADRNLFLAPALTLCLLSILMGGLVAGGYTVSEISPAMLLLCGVLAGLGVMRHRNALRKSWLALLLLAIVPMLILLPCIIDGIGNYTGGTCLDGWSYVTFGQSLQQFRLGAQGWLPMRAQYSAVWGSAIRFISPAFLALLAPFSGPQNDTQQILGHYLGWLFFINASTCLFFARAAGLKAPFAWMFVLLVCLSGWYLKIEEANSVDNALALFLIPAIVGIFIPIRVPSTQYGILIGAVFATNLYAYPESSPFTLAAIGAITAQTLICAPASQRRRFGHMGLIALLTVIVCVAPHVTGIVTFFRQQVHFANAPVGSRPGEPFYRSLGAHKYFLPGYWGLAPDFENRGAAIAQQYIPGYDVWSFAFACLLTIAMLAGITVLLRRREWGVPFFVLGMTAAYCIALMHLRYAYAAYKILVCAWFAVVYVAVVSISSATDALQSRLSKPSFYTIAGTAAAVFGGILASFFAQERIFYDLLPFKSVTTFSKIGALENIARGQPVAVLVDNTHANIWAVHFLRDSKLYLADEYRGYMAGEKELLDKSEPVDPNDIRFVVTDNELRFRGAQPLATLGPYYIWDWGRKPWALVTEINDPAGLREIGAAEPFVIGGSYTEIWVLSRINTNAMVSAVFAVGSKDLSKVQQRLLIRSGKGFSETHLIGSGPQSFEVPLQSGLNRILVRLIDKAPALIRASGLSVVLANEQKAGATAALGTGICDN
jgi:hypothetical protein